MQQDRSSMAVEVWLQEEGIEAWGDRPLDSQWQAWIHGWLAELQVDLSPIGAYELGLRLTDDAEIQQLNAQYRNSDRPTDVLAFAALESDLPLPDDLRSQMPLYLGDVVISIETAQRQAQTHSLHDELVWLAAHGVLHLLGWDHPDDDTLLQMLSQQRQLLNAIGLEGDRLFASYLTECQLLPISTMQP